jgi:IS605 OrfB family transposase
MYLTYSYRLKDSAIRKRLIAMSRTVNLVWNYCNEVSYNQLKKYGKWLSYYDLAELTKGCSKELVISSQTIQMICREYTKRRYQFRKQKLRWRTSKSLGWIPLPNQTIKQLAEDSFQLNKKPYRFWNSRPLEGKLKCASICQNSRGQWFINFVCEVEALVSAGTEQIGIDLGLKIVATCSNGQKFERPSVTKRYEKALAKAQRARKKRQVSKIHQKIQNSRKDQNHKFTSQLIKQCSFIAIGNIQSVDFTSGRLAKSVYDSGWYQIKSQLQYKALRHGATYLEVPEYYTTQQCSCCGKLTGPKGEENLSVREWACSHCRSFHDRDINAAKNILRLGLQTLNGDSTKVE